MASATSNTIELRAHATKTKQLRNGLHRSQDAHWCKMWFLFIGEERRLHALGESYLLALNHPHRNNWRQVHQRRDSGLNTARQGWSSQKSLSKVRFKSQGCGKQSNAASSAPKGTKVLCTFRAGLQAVGGLDAQGRIWRGPNQSHHLICFVTPQNEPPGKSPK